MASEREKGGASYEAWVRLHGAHLHVPMYDGRCSECGYDRHPKKPEPAPGPDPEAAEGEPIISRQDIEQWLLGMEKIESDPQARLMFIYAAGVVRSEVKLRDRLRARVQPRRVSRAEFHALTREIAEGYRTHAGADEIAIDVLDILGIEITPPEGGEDDG